MYTQSQQSSSSDPAEESRKREMKTRLEVELRHVRQRIEDRKRELGFLESAVVQLESDTTRKEGEIARHEQEVRLIQMKVQAETTTVRQAESTGRDAETQLRVKHEARAKLEHEIQDLERQIAEKRSEMMVIDQETASLVREKEQARQKFELGHFQSQAQGGHIHEQEMMLLRLKNDNQRARQDLEEKKRKITRMKQEAIMDDQEKLRVENELRAIGVY
jgi:chromosome segregation ATPase